MPGLPPEITVYPIHHLPILKAYSDQLSLVSLIKHYLPTAMGVDAGTVVRAMVLDTLSGRSPLYRLAECFAQQDIALLLGKTVLPSGPWGTVPPVAGACSPLASRPTKPRARHHWP